MFQSRTLCCVITAILAAVLILMKLTGYAFGPRGVTDGMTVTITGRLTAKEYKSSGLCYYVTFREDDASYLSYQTFFYPNTDDVVLSSQIQITGKIKKLNTATNEGQYDETLADLGKGIFFSLEEVEYTVRKTPLIQLREDLFRLRRLIMQVYEDSLYGEEAGILSAMVLGDKSDLSSEAKELFLMCGLAHIMCVSGTHISLLCDSLYRRLKRLGHGFAGPAVLSAVSAILYCLMCGAKVSAVRAVGMFLIMLVADVSGEAYDALTALFVVGAAQIAAQPYVIYDSSFQFSYVAVIGIHLVALPLKKLYEQHCRSIYRGPGGWQPSAAQMLIGQMILSASITAVTLPMVAYYYYEIPVYSMAVSLLVTPLLGYLLGLGLAGGIVGTLQAGGGGGWLSRILLYPCHMLLYALEYTADRSLNLPCARWIVGKPEVWQIILYWLILYALSRLLCKGTGKTTERSLLYRVQAHLPARTGTIAAIALMMACPVIFCLKPDSRGFEVTFLDVGQGDGIYVGSESGLHIMVDGGSTSVNELGTYRILPFLKSRRIRRIDYWFVTHPDTDHMSGIAEVLESGYRVNCLVLAKAFEEDDDFDALRAAAEESGTKLIYFTAGDRVRDDDGFAVTCLYPGDEKCGDDANDSSLTLWVNYGDFDAIMAGDLTSTVEDVIAAEVKQAIGGDVEVLKISHHGSNYSSSTLWLETIDPKLAVISCGTNNYGHPGKDTLARIEALGIPVRITQEEGEIRIRAAFT